MERLLIVSGDNHAGASPDSYAPFLERKYLPALEDLKAEEAEFLGIFGPFASFAPEDLDVIDDRGAIRSGGITGAWDVKRRLAEMDAEGIAAEIVHSGHQASTMPFFSQVNKPWPAEYRQAGIKAYHRWLASCMEQSDGRIHGVGDPGPCNDLADTVRELHWIAENGFVSVGVPGIVRDEALPSLLDGYFEPFWAACEDASLVLSVHAGWGGKQGTFFEFAKVIAENMDVVEGDGRGKIREIREKILRERLQNSRTSPFQLDIGPRRVFWQLILAGVFDRHPDLRIAFTEVRADWLPGTLVYLDQTFERERPDCKLRPSEYFARHGYVTPSSPRRNEIEIRNVIGMDRLMFGVDYPHPEGTWPNTHDWIKATFHGLDEREARKILGENAVACYGLDGARLRGIANRIGPWPADLLASDGALDARKAKHFESRAGFLKDPESVDTDLLGAAVRADLAERRVALAS
jgi:predicted TIM-barrel fold metal-dependent hydrolase